MSSMNDLKIEITRNNNITDVHTPCDEIPGDIVRSPRDVEYQAFLHPEKNVETFDDLVHIADEDGIEKEESEDYRHAFIPYYG